MLLTLLAILCSSYVILSKKVITRPAASAHHHWSLQHHSSNETNDVVASFIRLTFAVKQQNIDLLDDKLMSVSSTKSKQYGQLLTLKEVQELTDPKPIHMDAVMAFLASHGIDRSDTESSSGFIRTTVTFEQAERILSTKYYTYRHTFTGRYVQRCEQYELPDTIADILDFVSPTIDFPASIRIKTEQQQQLQQQQATPTTTTTQQQVHNNNPSSLRSLYFVGEAVGGKSKASQGTHCNITIIIVIIIIMLNDDIVTHLITQSHLLTSTLSCDCLPGAVLQREGSAEVLHSVLPLSGGYPDEQGGGTQQGSCRYRGIPRRRVHDHSWCW